MADPKTGNVIIIKKKKVGGHGYHGGAWKIAYADFVTAMMAFFLLLWLLSSVTEEQLKGIADYFSPTISSKTSSAGDGVLGGESVGRDGPMQKQMAAPEIPLTRPDSKQFGPDEASKEPPKDMKTEEAEKIAAEAEEKRMEEAADRLKQMIQNDEDLKLLLPNVIIEKTPEGIRIQLVDQEKKSMFPSGSARMYGHTEKLVAMVAKALQGLPNKISVDGHTDSTPFAYPPGYSNWDLSANRALVCYRALMAGGIAENRFSMVSGRADTQPFVKDNPKDPRNRRISMTLLKMPHG